MLFNIERSHLLFFFLVIVSSIVFSCTQTLFIEDIFVRQGESAPVRYDILNTAGNSRNSYSRDLSFTIIDENIAEVDGLGIVTGIEPGVTIILIKTKRINGVATVTVNPNSDNSN